MSKRSGGKCGAPTWLAIDIGGANLKAAHGDGSTRTIPFEVWRRPGDLSLALAALIAGFPRADGLAVTMTAELCDCFRTKDEGVRAILDAVGRVAGDCPVSVWGIDGRFHEPGEIKNRPSLAAAANWLALAVVAARLIPRERGILIDVGSTTTDLIPLSEGAVAARGRTDTERLATGELVYAGVRRTPLCALATELPFRSGSPIGLAAELFATTLDVYVTLGGIVPDPVDVATADGRPATIDAARDRLARMVCADRDGFSQDDARALARSADRCLIYRLAEAAERACAATVGRPEAAVIGGSGEFLRRRLAVAVLGPDRPILSLAETWGVAASSAACARALLALASEFTS